MPKKEMGTSDVERRRVLLQLKQQVESLNLPKFGEMTILRLLGRKNLAELKEIAARLDAGGGDEPVMEKLFQDETKQDRATSSWIRVRELEIVLGCTKQLSPDASAEDLADRLAFLEEKLQRGPGSGDVEKAMAHSSPGTMHGGEH